MRRLALWAWAGAQLPPRPPKEPPPPPPEYWPAGYLDPNECTHGCLAWTDVPDSITKPYGFDSVHDLFFSGEAPDYKVCAKPGYLPRQEPWCYCPGPLQGWAYCERVPVNCSNQPRRGGDSVEASSCSHRNNLCGHWNLPCRKAVLSEYSKHYYSEYASYTEDGAFQSVMMMAISKEDCEAGEYFVKMELRGSWRHDRASTHLNDTSMLTTEVNQAWLQIVNEVVCPPSKSYGSSDAPPDCFQSSDVLRDLCPCNGWPFLGQMKCQTTDLEGPCPDMKVMDLYDEDKCRQRMAEGADCTFEIEKIKRNVVMFCRPKEQCPLLMSEIVRRPRFVLYNASRKATCFYRPDSTPTLGWGQGLEPHEFHPDPPICVRKITADDCVGTNDFLAMNAGRLVGLGLLAALAAH
jgi:hypothetical protein